jgi:ATP-binding cassette subfamily F protein uup
VVSHDRYFLERVTDHVMALTGGQLAFLPGGVDEYLARRDAELARLAAAAAATAQAAGTQAAGAARVPSAAGADGAAAAATGPAADAPSAARQRAGQKELARLERQISRIAGTEASLSEELARSATDYERLIDLGAQLRTAQEERTALEERWLVLAEEMGG